LLRRELSRKLLRKILKNKPALKKKNLLSLLTKRHFNVSSHKPSKLNRKKMKLKLILKRKSNINANARKLVRQPCLLEKLLRS